MENREKVSRMEFEMIDFSNECLCVFQARLREEIYRKTIDDMQLRLRLAQQRSDGAETDVEKLQQKADKLQGTLLRLDSIGKTSFSLLERLAEERKKSQQIQKVINSTSKP